MIPLRLRCRPRLETKGINRDNVELGYSILRYPVGARFGHSMWRAVAVNAPAILAAPAGFIPAIAVTLWLGLLGAAGAVLLVAGVLAWRQHSRVTVAPMPPLTPLRTRRPTPADLARLMAEVDALSIQAVSAGMTAAGAEVAVATARARCRAAEWARERAWYDYDTAHLAYVSALRAGAGSDEVWPTASTSGVWPVLIPRGAEPTAATVTSVAGSPSRPPVPGPGDEPDLRDDVARAALAAYRRGGISVEQLRRILRHSSGWNHLHARHEREVLLRRAAEREARRRYHAAAAAERSAYQAVDVATVAARAWADEAAEAAEEARLARAYAAEYRRRAATRRRLRRLGRRDEALAAAPG
jgi:hypothetical protein